MQIKLNLLLTAALILICSGCFAPKPMDEKYFGVRSVKFHETGMLEINGDYLESAWGVGEIKGRVEKDAIILSGVVEFGADGTISNRMMIPDKINEVRFGSTVLWRRGQRENIFSPEQNRGKTAVFPVTVRTISRLNFGGTAEKMECKRLSFEEIFWGVVPVKQVDDQDDAGLIPGDLNVKKLNAFKDLEVISIKGSDTLTSIDLAGLKLPKLKTLILDNVEVTGLDKADLSSLEEFYLNDPRMVPVGKVALPGKMPKLHTVGIQAFNGNFDYNSLAGKAVKTLALHGDFSEFGFLKDMPVEKLSMSGFTAGEKDLQVLNGMPLKFLVLEPYRPIRDWSFLAGLQLEFLDIRCAAGDNFSPKLLRGMPLKVLRMYGVWKDFGSEWSDYCQGLPLQEIILRNAVVPEYFLAGKEMEKLALIHCVWQNADPVTFLNKLPSVRQLAVWRIFKQHSGRQYVMVDHRLDWKKLSGLSIQNLCVSTLKPEFLQRMPWVKKIAIRNTGKSRIAMEELENMSFDILLIPQKYHRDLIRHNIKVRHPEVRDVFAAAW